jgi:hypothetical protein
MDGANWTTALATVVIAVATGVNVWIVKRAANATNQANSRREKVIGNIEFLIGSLDSHIPTRARGRGRQCASGRLEAIPKEQEHGQCRQDRPDLHQGAVE